MTLTAIKTTKSPERPAGAEGNFYNTEKKNAPARNERPDSPVAQTKC
jgi:hypothetical protein